MKSLKQKKLVNHVAFILDGSGSMFGLVPKMRQVIDNQIKIEKQQSKRTGQETRVSIFHFGDYLGLVCLDSKLSEVPSSSFYEANRGGTALISSTIAAVNQLATLADNKADHAFMVYVLTDGGETNAKHRANELKQLLEDLNDDWTMAILVPNRECASHAKSYGFPSGNIQIWETTEDGLEQGHLKMAAATQSYYTMRSSGVKSTKTLFQLASVTKKDVKRKLDEVNPSEYQTLIVRSYDDGKAIKEFVQSWTGNAYRVGSAYYQLTKPEKVQAGKVIAVIEKSTGKMFSGPAARTLLKLPAYEVKVEPASFLKFDVFIQSHSTNRKIVAGTHLIVFK